MVKKQRDYESRLEAAILEVMQKDIVREELRDVLKLAGDSCKRNTLANLIENDIAYQKKFKEYEEKFREYRALSIDKQQKEVIEDFIAISDDLNYEMQQLIYISGVLDGYRILKTFGVTVE